MDSLFHSIMMEDADLDITSQFHHTALCNAIVGGVLNVSTETSRIKLDHEPIIRDALRSVGLELERHGMPGVMSMLSARVNRPGGGEINDYGPTLEAVYFWSAAL
jgi:hypothetical protein